MTGHDDRDAVTKLVFRYAELVDEGQYAAVAHLFEHSTFRAVVGSDVYTRTGADQVLAQFEQMVITYDGIPCTKHVTTNVVVQVDDHERTAASRSYYSVLQARPDLPLQVVIAGRYHDAFAEVGGEWRFTDRLIFSDLVGDLSHHLRQNAL